MSNPLLWVWEAVQKKAARVLAERLNRDLISYHLRTRNNMENLKRALKPGDVVLVEGNKLISRVIMAITHSTWSHCALYVGDGKIIDP
ncbi:MAG TPA: lipo-like protein, partial [bacterium]|nr:lipo-like protein [bacterium]